MEKEQKQYSLPMYELVIVTDLKGNTPKGSCGAGYISRMGQNTDFNGCLVIFDAAVDARIWLFSRYVEETNTAVVDGPGYQYANGEVVETFMESQR